MSHPRARPLRDGIDCLTIQTRICILALRVQLVGVRLSATPRTSQAVPSLTQPSPIGSWFVAEQFRASCPGSCSPSLTHQESLTVVVPEWISYVSIHSLPCLFSDIPSTMPHETPPSYYQISPETDQAMTSLTRGRREARYTTIILREIIYPSGGCPCHPGNPDQHRRTYSPERTSWVPRGMPEVIERPASERTNSSCSNSSSASQSSGEGSRSKNRRPWGWLSQRRTSNLR